MAGSYKHAPISKHDAIRLLILESGKESDPLRCLFHEQSILNRKDAEKVKNSPGLSTHYTAVSYTWHASPDKQEFDFIQCNGETIQISKNLAQLLHRVRSEYWNKKLWIDQICIDQKNDKEKEQQIPLMGNIYEQAENVIFWMGEEADETGKAFELARKLEKHFIDIAQEKASKPAPYVILNEEMLGELGIPSLTSGEWWPLMELFSSPAVPRLWVVQEIALASRLQVRCGSHVGQLQAFGAAAALIHICEWAQVLQFRYLMALIEQNKEIPTNLPAIEHVVGLWNRRQTLQAGLFDSLETLLFTTRRCLTSRDYRHDRIFGVLGLLAPSLPNKQLPEELKPSYLKTPEEVFRDATKYLLCNSSLEILSAVEDHSIRPTNSVLPSWVPCYDVPPTTNAFGMTGNKINLSSIDSKIRTEIEEMASVHGESVGKYLQNVIPHLFNAGGPYVPPIWDPARPNVLKLQAHKVDSVCLLGPPCPGQEITDPLAEFFEGSAKCVDIFGVYPTGEDLVEAFWRTIIVDTHNREHPSGAIMRRHFVGFCLQTAWHLKWTLEAEKWIEEEGDAVPKDKAEFMPRLVARIYQSLKTDTEEEKMVLQVYEGHHVLPIQPFLLNEYARGLYSVFTLGIFRQIIAGIYPHDYLKSSDGSSYRATMRR